MNTLLRLAVGGLAVFGVTATASAQYPGYPHRPPVIVERPIIVERPVVVERPVIVERPVVVERPVIVERPVVVKPQLPVYSLDTFVRDFRPCAGTHHIAIIHPVTKCPVEVCFTLPDRKLREVEVKRREIEFEFGLGFQKVTLDFRHDGTVKVHGG